MICKQAQWQNNALGHITTLPYNDIKTIPYLNTTLKRCSDILSLHIHLTYISLSIQPILLNILIIYFPQGLAEVAEQVEQVETPPEKGYSCTGLTLSNFNKS